MDQMNIKQAWETTLDDLAKMPAEKRKHFAALIISLAECYKEDNNAKAVVLINNDDALAMFAAGADEFAAAEMVSKASEIMGIVHTADAPERSMFN